MAGNSKKPWNLFSFRDLPIFDPPETETSNASGESAEKITSQPTYSTTDDDLLEELDAFYYLYIDSPRGQRTDATDEHTANEGTTNEGTTNEGTTNEGTTNEGKNKVASQSGQPTLKDIPEKPFRFLDLPAEIRELIYDFLRPSQCPKLKGVIFTPQVFQDTIPESISLDIVTWSCRGYAKLLSERKKDRSEYENTQEGWGEYFRQSTRWWRICEDENCDQSAKDFTKLTRVNRQIRKEVQKILLSRCGECEGTYNFHTETSLIRDDSRIHRPDPREDTAIQLSGLDRVERWVATDLGYGGIPFAVLKTRMWVSGTECFRYELLVPNWKIGGGGISWRKLSSVELTKDCYGERECWSSLETAKREVSKGYNG